MNFSLKALESLENIIINCCVIAITFWLIIKFKFIHFIKFGEFETKNLQYYLPLLVYIVLLSNSNNVFEYDRKIFYTMEMFLLFLEKLTSAFLEEIIFRGLVLAFIINKYIERKNELLISVFLTSLIFGTTHFINIVTQAELLTVNGVIKQVYIATCLGVMFSSMFLKSRNIFILIFGHFIFNMFSIFDELKMNAASASIRVVEDKTTLEIIASLVLIFIIFGIPVLIGIAILRQVDIKQLKSELKLG